MSQARNKQKIVSNEWTQWSPRNKKAGKYKVNFAHTTMYKNSAVPYCQRVLNQLEEEEGRRRGEEEEEEERRREEEEEE